MESATTVPEEPYLMEDHEFNALVAANSQPWQRWQRAVVDVIRNQFDGALADTSLEDVDWEAWRRFYEQGRSAPSAVNHAFLLDL
jgi:hypothetical protein